MPSVIVACLAALVGGYLALSGNAASSVSYAQAAATPGGPAPAQIPAVAVSPKVGEVPTFAGIEMVWIPPGTFMMGLSPKEAKGWPRGEYTQRQVTLTRGFWMGKCEVTNAQFRAFVSETGFRTDAERIGWAYGHSASGTGRWGKQAGMCWRNPAWTIEDRQPVAGITWNDAHAYVDWLNTKRQGTFRLPTSARWEYACRAGTTTKYPWGDKQTEGQGYFNGADQARKRRYPDADLAPGLPWNDGYALVAPVGQFKPNAWGLYDMIGNADEWCEDSWGKFTGKPLTDPIGGDASIPPGPVWDVMHASHIVRHGSFDFHPYGSWFYGPAKPAEPRFDVGFRVCREE